jgi:predicted nucleic acid-binding protein
VVYLLDTNVLIRLRDSDAEVVAKIGALDGAILMSIISRVELEGGVYRDPAWAEVRRARLGAMLLSIPALSFDESEADAYRAIVESAGYSRRKLVDRMIAAQALAHQATLVTHNAADFRDIPGLQLLAW